MTLVGFLRAAPDDRLQPAAPGWASERARTASRTDPPAGRA